MKNHEQEFKLDSNNGHTIENRVPSRVRPDEENQPARAYGSKYGERSTWCRAHINTKTHRIHMSLTDSILIVRTSADADANARAGLA